MADYKHFYVQQQTYDGTNFTGVGDVVDTYDRFKVVCQELPFKYIPETKDLPQRDWYDEDGVDVYFPIDGIKFKAYDIEVKFLYVGKETDMAADIKEFVDFMTGRTNIVSGATTSGTKNVSLIFFDEYTSTGKRGAYVSSISDELFYYTDKSIDAICLFSLNMKIIDPVYEVSFINGVLA